MEERPTYTAVRRTRNNVRTFLGVQPVATPPEGVKGILVRSVTPDSPAAKAGVKVGDVVKKVGDKEMKQVRDIYTSLIGKKAGDKLQVVVERDGKTVTMEVELAAIRGR